MKIAKLLLAPSAVLLLAVYLLLRPDQNTNPELERQFDQHAIRNFSYWENNRSVPWSDRVFLPPVELVNYVRIDNKLGGYKDIPSAYALSGSEKKMISQILTSLPEVVQKKLESLLLGIFVVSDLGTSGYSEEIIDSKTLQHFGFIVLDSTLFAKKANHWVTFKESAPYALDQKTRLEGKIAENAQNTIEGAVRYILIHELAHILSLNEKITQVFHRRSDPNNQFANNSFFRLSWSLDNKLNVLPFGNFDFPLRNNIFYYREAKLPSDKMLEVYNGLEKTNFPTLYASTSAQDDWAESFVNYLHTQFFKLPFQILIYKDDLLIKSYENCWQQKRCSEKKHYLENFLGLDSIPK